MASPSPLREKSMNLAVRIVNLYKHLVAEKKEFVLSKQLLRSGTSPGANIREAQNGESTADFIHKLEIAQKETDETLYWLELLHRTKYLSDSEFQSMYHDTDELLRMIRSAVLTKKKNKLIEKTKTVLLIALPTHFFFQHL
jgi:four helix bundle protein